MAEQTDRLREAILALAAERAPTGSLCPSDAARAVGGEHWRDLDPDATWRGPIRIRAR